MPGHQVLDKDGNEIELKDDDDAMDTFNLARMDADDDRHRAFSEEAEFQESGFDIEDAPEDAGATTSTWTSTTNDPDRSIVRQLNNSDHVRRKSQDDRQQHWQQHCL